MQTAESNGARPARRLERYREECSRHPGWRGEAAPPRGTPAWSARDTPSGPNRPPKDGAVRRGGGISAEEEAQLPWTRRGSGASSWGVACAKRRFTGEDAGDVVGALSDLDEAHASAAAGDGAGGDVDGEDATQEPGPRMARGRWRGGGVGSSAYGSFAPVRRAVTVSGSAAVRRARAARARPGAV